MNKPIIILCIVILCIVVAIAVWLIVREVKGKTLSKDAEDWYNYVIEQSLKDLSLPNTNCKIVFMEEREGVDLYLLIVENNGVYLVGVNENKYVKVEEKLL